MKSWGRGCAHQIPDIVRNRSQQGSDYTWGPNLGVHICLEGYQIQRQANSNTSDAAFLVLPCGHSPRVVPERDGYGDGNEGMLGDSFDLRRLSPQLHLETLRVQGPK